MSKQYYIVYTIQKEKCGDYKDLSFKCTINDNIFNRIF